jgi:phosphotriesterase-related protein
MKELITTLGRVSESAAGLILPHEHVFVDLRKPGEAVDDRVATTEVVEVMAPELRRARGAGIGVIVEASCVGVGRRADLLRLVSEAAELPLVAPTGVYREPWIPEWVHRSSEGRLFEWMRGELSGEIEGSGVRAGWIKCSAGDNGLTECETKVFRAAVRAAKETGAVIGSHTIRGSVVRDQLRILESLGLDPGRFIWIHTQAEDSLALHLEAAKRGAWVEFDGIGSPQSDATYVDLIRRVLDAGLGARILLSQDRGQYDPAKPRGGEQLPYTYLTDEFLPRLAAAGIGEETIRRLTHANPFEAFAREGASTLS